MPRVIRYVAHLFILMCEEELTEALNGTYLSHGIQYMAVGKIHLLVLNPTYTTLIDSMARVGEGFFFRLPVRIFWAGTVTGPTELN